MVFFNMPYAFFHIVFSWILIKCCQFFTKIKINSFAWFLLFFGAVLPDIDYLLEWVLHLQAHRMFTHSLLMLVTVFVISFILFNVCYSFNIIEKKKILFYAGIFTFGVFSHLLLDFLISFRGGIPIFWPNTDFYGFRSGVVSYASLINFNFMNPEYLLGKLKWTIFDMGIGVLWLFYLIYLGKIKEF